jgi:hypothetical protein
MLTITDAAGEHLQRVGQPVADEFTKAMVDVRLGLPLTDALGRIALRMRSDDLKLTVMSIGIQQEVGGNLAEILRATVATTVPNFVRGAVIPLTMLFLYLKPYWGVLHSAGIVGLLTIAVALLALRGLDETFAKDMDYLE